MIKILVDTCVWLDLAKDVNQKQLLEVLEELDRQKKIQLIIPRIVRTEFDRNKSRVAKEGLTSLSAVFKRTKDAVAKFGDPRQKQKILRQLNDLDHKIPRLGEVANESIARIEKLLNNSEVFEPTDSIKLLAAQRAIDNLAPFHRDKNSMADAVILETYIAALNQSNPKDRLFFITHNVKDFSSNGGDVNLPHKDLEMLFSKIKSVYFIKLSEALKRIDKSLVSEVMIQNEWAEEPRSFSEIAESIGEMIDKVWYNRHQNLRYKVEKEKVKIVPKGTPFDGKNHHRVVHEDIWEGAKKAATRVEKEYGIQDLGPYDDFEWGMLNGKLSALRWVLGEEWDMLDT